MKLKLLPGLLALTLGTFSPTQASCGKHNDCVKSLFHPGYDVTYADADWWALEKHPSGIDAMALVPREFIPHSEWAMARSPEEVAQVWNMGDCFPTSQNAYSHAAVIYDDQGEPHHMRLEWGSWFETRSRGLFKKRQFVHYIRATVDHRLIFMVDDCVGEGLYVYEDFFRLGNRTFRLQVELDSNKRDYRFGSVLMAYTPASTEANLKAPASPTPKAKSKAKGPVAKGPVIDKPVLEK